MEKADRESIDKEIQELKSKIFDMKKDYEMTISEFSESKNLEIT